MADERPRILFRPRQLRYLAALERAEIYGMDLQDIVRRFVDDGIKRALERGHIKQDDGDETKS